MSRSYADGEWPGLLGPVEEADRESRAGQGRLRSPPETRCRYGWYVEDKQAARSR